MSEKTEVFFLGSMPKDVQTPQEAMETVLHESGDRFAGYLSHGETTRGEGYIIPILERLATHDAFEQAKKGSYDGDKLSDFPNYRLKEGASVDVRELADLLGYYEETMQALPAFRTLQEQGRVEGVRLLAGIPAPLDMAFMFFGPRALRPAKKGDNKLPYYRMMADATATEVQRVHDELGDDVVFQLEMPGETTLTAKTPLGLHMPMSYLAAKAAGNFMRLLPRSAKVGVHLCHGNFKNRPEVVPASLEKVVRLGNQIVRHADRRLEYIHYPALRRHEAPLDPQFYAALSRVALPRETRMFLGIVDEGQELGEQLAALTIAEKAYGKHVDGVAPVCGLGRRANIEVAIAAIRSTVQLAAKHDEITRR